MKKRFAFIISIAAAITLIFCFSPDSYTDAFNTANNSNASNTDPSDGLPGGTDKGGTDKSGADPSGADPSGADPNGAEPSGADPSGAEPSGADPRRTYSDDIYGGTETSGADPIIELPVIMLDPGHGGVDGGAVSGSAVEKEINLSVCLKLRDILEDSDITVYMTRTEDTFIEVIDRVKYANDLDADMLLSIHCNTFKSSLESGLTIFTSYKGRTYKNLTDEIYAGSIHDETARLVEYGLKDRGIVSHINYCLTTAGKMPSVLIELGFITNPGDVELLLSADFLGVAVQAIADGIVKSVQAAAETE